MTPAPARRPNPRYLALLRVDLQALHRGRVDGDELCEIRGVGPIPVPVAQGLLGQAVLQLVITRGVDVLNVTHLGRGPTAAQRVALAWTSPTCIVAGCHRARIEIDHREPWAKTRHTRLDDLDPLCSFHHDLKTRYGWALIPGTGKRPMVPPEDPRHPKHQQPTPPTSEPPDRPPGQRPDERSGVRPGRRPAGRDTRGRPNPPSPPTRPSPARGPTRRRKAAAQPTLPDPPGDPSPAPRAGEQVRGSR